MIQVRRFFTETISLPLLALIIFFGFAQNSLYDLTTGATALVPAPPQYIGLSVDPRVVNRFLGIRLVVADLIWIDTMFKADTANEPKAFSDLYKAFKTIVTLNPHNLFAYYVAGLYLSVIKDDVKGATAILRDGVQFMERNPDSIHSFKQAWQIPFTLGHNLLFEEQEFEEGMKWIRKAAEYKHAPKYALDLAKRVSTPQGQLEVAGRVLNELYRFVDDADQKKVIEEKMADVAVKQQLLELNEGFERFLGSTGAYGLPREKAFKLYMRTIGHPAKDLRGRPIGLGSLGKISSLSNQ